jgi:hypothetical protein
MPSSEFKAEFSEELSPLLSFVIARNHYVVGRVCFLNDLEDTGCLLAHQSIEMFAKAICWLAPDRYYFAKKPDLAQSGKVNVWGHDLRILIKYGAAVAPGLSEILESKVACDFLDYLLTAYTKRRFGIQSNFARGNAAPVFDWVVQILDTAYLDELGANELERVLYVPHTFREDFLHGNQAFSERMISDQFGAKWLYTLPNRTDMLHRAPQGLAVTFGISPEPTRISKSFSN